jgi:hypothetical protein
LAGAQANAVAVMRTDGYLFLLLNRRTEMLFPVASGR